MHNAMHVIPSLPASALELCPLLLEDEAPLLPVAMVALVLEGVVVLLGAVVLLLGAVAVLLGAVAVLLLLLVVGAAAVVVVAVVAVASLLSLLLLVVMLAAEGLASTDGRLSDPFAVAVALPASVQ